MVHEALRDEMMKREAGCAIDIHVSFVVILFLISMFIIVKSIGAKWKKIPRVITLPLGN